LNPVLKILSEKHRPNQSCAVTMQRTARAGLRSLQVKSNEIEPAD
jgi:hypothetical protein